MKKILITGGAGFIGVPLTHLLIAEGYEVHMLINSTEMPQSPLIFQHKISMFDDFTLESFLEEHRFEHLIHLAWYTGNGCQSSNVNLDWVSASIRLLQAFQRHGGKNFLGAGSMSEYDFSYGYLTEDVTPLLPTTLYGMCKASFYHMSRLYCEQNGIKFQWARIFNVYGPNEKTSRLMPSATISMLKGENVRVSDCVKFQDYLYVNDTASAIAALFKSNVQGAVNISSGVPVQLRFIVELIADLTQFSGQILWGVIPRTFDDPVVIGNNTRLSQEVGFVPQFTLKDGLTQTIEFWKKATM